MDTGRLMFESAAYHQMAAIIERLDHIPVAQEAVTYRKAILDLKEVVKEVEKLEEKR